VTNLYTSAYLSNLLKLGLLKKDDDGTYTLAMAAPDDCVLTSFAVEQTGGWVAGILRDPKKYIGSRVDACSEVITVGEIAKVLSDMSGKTVKTLGIPGGESFLEGRDVKKMGLEDFYLNFLAFYKGCAYSHDREHFIDSRIVCSLGTLHRARRCTQSNGIRRPGSFRTRRLGHCWNSNGTEYVSLALQLRFE
jgi:hypothetical protein